MPAFETPTPVAVSLTLNVADIYVDASERGDTTVEIQAAANSGRSQRAAEETTVELVDGRLRVKTPKHLGSMFGHPGKITINIRLPRGSSLDADTSIGDLHVTGELGECRFKTGYGDIRIGRTGGLRLRTGAGDISVDHAAGDAELSTGTGELRLGHVDGAVVLKSSNGDTWLGEAVGAVNARAANGDIVVDRAAADVTARSAHGDLRVGEAASGAVNLTTAAGRVEIGIPAGTAAWLELHTDTGTVHNGLQSASGPDAGDLTVEVRARSYFGDIFIHRV
jgi:hypothetical protein